MKKAIFFLLLPLLVLPFCIAAQKTQQLEITPYVRYDKYSQFTYNHGGRYSTDSLTMKGTGFGVNVNYKYAWKPLFVTIGIGYYNYAFNKLENTSYLGPRDSRDINFPTRIQILYSTIGYYYHTISLNIGLGKNFALGKETWLSASVMGSNYFTFKQTYKISEEPTYKSSQKRSFAQCLAIKAGLLRQFGKVTLGPNVFVPLYSSWHKDDVFLENGSEKRSKWLNGIGFGIDVNIHLKKNK